MRKFLVLYIAAICCFSASPLAAQDEEIEPAGVGSSLMAGCGLGISNIGGAAEVHLTQRFGGLSATLRFLYTGHLLNFFPKNNSYVMKDIGILLGYALPGERTLFILEAGLGRTTGKHYFGESDSWVQPANEYESSIGLIVGCQVIMRSSEHFGMGFYPFWNMNENRSMIGVNFEMFFGQLD